MANDHPSLSGSDPVNSPRCQNSMQTKTYLTTENIETTARTLQALDALSENVFNEKHADDLQKKLKASESDIANMAIQLNQAMPGQFMLINGHGYRMLFSVFTNMLLATGRDDFAALAKNARIPEDELPL